ncbi:MAG: class I adenylate-forming enzyme family protein [Candidatus Zixiibacteriota bacterium]
MRLFDILRRGAVISPDGTAIEYGDVTISYRELLTRVAKAVEFISAQGLDKGSRIAVMIENSVEYAVAYFAVTAAGFVIVPVDTSVKPDKIRYILDDCDTRMLFIQKKYTRHIDTIIDEKTKVKVVVTDRNLDLSSSGVTTASFDAVLNVNSEKPLDELLDGLEAVAQGDELRHDNLGDCPHELAAIFYTSGSTGTPKGVMLSHRNLVSNTVATVEYLKLTAKDSIMVILPFYYIYGNSLLLTHMLCGGKTVIDNRFAFPQVILDTMKEKETTGFSGVPSNFMILLTNQNFVSANFPKLRYLTQAGGAMAPEVIKKVMAAFSDKEIYIMYGQTEGSPRLTWLPPDMLADNVGSIGIPVPGVTIKISDANGNEAPVGQVGEIAVSGDCVMMGYWNQPEEQEQVLRNGWLFTGDLARRDENGLIFIVSRKKEIMKVGGNRVSAKEVEEKILELDAVQEVAVFSVPDDILGEAIKAVVVCRSGQEIEAKVVQNHCKAELAVHKVPKYVEFIAELPKYQSGKVNKQALAGVQE